MKQKALLRFALVFVLLLSTLPAAALERPMEVLTPLEDSQYLLGMAAHQGRPLIRSSQGLLAWTEEKGLEEIAKELSGILAKSMIMDARIQQVYEADVIAILNRALDGQVGFEDAAREADGRLQLMVKENQ